jgi:hypothetical protein
MSTMCDKKLSVSLCVFVRQLVVSPSGCEFGCLHHVYGCSHTVTWICEQDVSAGQRCPQAVGAAPDCWCAHARAQAARGGGSSLAYGLKYFASALKDLT